jgi:hypothetical protein
MTIRSVLRPCVLSLLVVCSSADAIAFEKIRGTGVAIENLTLSYQSVSFHSAIGREQAYHGQPDQRTAYLQTYSNRTLVGWQPMTSPYCQTSEGHTTIQLIYSRKGGHSGKFSCDPMVRGGDTETSVSRAGGSYTTKTTVKGDVVSLSGQMTYTETYKSRSQTGGQSESTKTTRVSQKLQIRITDSGCEVLAFEESGVTDERSKGLTDDNHRYTTKGTNWRTVEPTSTTFCKFL